MNFKEYLKDAKVVSKGLYSDRLNDLTSVKVKAINDLNNQIEIIYIKDDEKKYLSISIHQGFYTYYKCYFEFDIVKLDDRIMDNFDFMYDGSENYHYKKSHNILDEISYIHDISYDLYYYDDKDYPKQMQCEQITIIANDKNNTLKSYTLYFKEDEEYSKIFDIKIEVLRNNFISKIITKDVNLVVSLSYDKANIYTSTIKDDEYEGKLHRLHTPNYVSNLKHNPKKKIKLKKDKDSIYLSNLGFKGSGFELIELEYYDKLDNEDKANFDKYANDLVKFLNTLFINKIFDYHKKIDFDGKMEYQEFLDSFKSDGFEFERLYLETWHGVPSLEVFKVTKDNIEIKLKVSSDIVVEWYIVEVYYNDKLFILDNIKEIKRYRR